MAVAVEADLHDPLVGTLVYNGQGASNSVTWKSASGQPKAAWSLTTDVRTEGGKSVRYYTLYAGLAHQWYAPGARPARRGTRFTLLRDGEEAWATVNAELSLAETQVNASSWWWTSEVEIVRDPAVHMWLSSQERWANTIMGTLESMSGVDRRILVNQFYSQDGLLSDVTIDDELIAKAKAAGDDFEFMGHANDAHGAFVVKPQPVDFAGRIAAAGALTSTKAVPVASAPYPAFSGPIAVDTTKLPLGLGTFELPIASWHQKFMTIDDGIAFVGGMNFKTTDWDGSDHVIWNERRMQFDATTAARQKVKDKKKEPDFGPRKDYMVRLEGPAAADVQDVFHKRWMAQLESGAQYSDLASPYQTLGPAAKKADGQQVQVVSTMPAPYAEYGILEALLRAIPQAKQYIFIEDQYFRAPILVDRIIERMNAVPGLVLIVVTNPVSEWTDPGCWQTHLVNQKLAQLFPSRYRTYALQAFDYVDTDCTFCVDEVDAHFVGMDLHSKLVLIDDVWIEVGSCNSNNRGLLYEGELAVVMHDPARVKEARDAVFGNMLGSAYVKGTAPKDLIPLFDAQAKKNQAVFDLWDDEGMDLDLDGDPLPQKYKPSGFVYPLKFGAPDDCFIENVGPDVT
jgi:phosphatidylserine/phosphatidylglycerophosphate/cardiolipin synthase-like enzyme